VQSPDALAVTSVLPLTKMVRSQDEASRMLRADLDRWHQHGKFITSSLKIAPFGEIPMTPDAQQKLLVWLKNTAAALVAYRATSLEHEEMILQKLTADAEAYLGQEVDGAVITVPAYFNDAQRQATKRAGELAGFTVERIINEPTAAALAYGLDKLKEKSKIAVYDLGGGTFDLSILELNEGVFQVLSTNGNTRLGGDDLDRVLVEFLWQRIASVSPKSEIRNPQSTARLREAAEVANPLFCCEGSTAEVFAFIESDLRGGVGGVKHIYLLIWTHTPG
jgi:hypothetical protein